MSYSTHGHVFARADGKRADCGGPRACDGCRVELGRLVFMTTMISKLFAEWLADPSQELADIVYRGRRGGDGFDGQLRDYLDARAAERAAAKKAA